MFCRQCGKPIDDGQELCEDCKNVANVNSSANTNTNANMNNGTNPTVNVNVNTGYTNPNPNASQKSKIAGGLLGIFLGGLGVHNFYLGFTGKAVAQLLITVLSCGILSPVSAIWGLIEGILILCGNITTDANGNTLSD